MVREPDVALLIIASGSFVDKHKQAHIKKRYALTRFQKKNPFLRDHYVLKTKIEKSESIVNNISFASQKKTKVCSQTNFWPHTHRAKN